MNKIINIMFGFRKFSSSEDLKKLCAEKMDHLHLEIYKDNYMSIVVMVISNNVFYITDDIRKKKPDVLNINRDKKKLKELISIIDRVHKKYHQHTGNFYFNNKKIESIYSIINKLLTNELTHEEYLRVGGWGGC